MSTRTTQHSYTIKETAALIGLPASTLRYYESIGVIPPISRGASSGHRVYDEDDLDQLMWVACLSATGMSVSDMRTYISNGGHGAAKAREQVELLEQQERRLAIEAEQVALRQRYVQLKIGYWNAIEAGDQARAEALSDEAYALADRLKQTKRNEERR